MKLLHELKDTTVNPSIHTPQESSLSIDDPEYIAGRFNPADHPDFISFNSDTGNTLFYLRTEVYQAYLKMAEAAAKDSVFLSIVSATRNFDYQKEIWENKWTGNTLVNEQKLNVKFKDPVERAQKILEYSAPPGYSRHHWGTDFDLNSTEPEYFETEEGMRIYNWLNIHAGSFGFCQTYTAFSNERPRGFNEEKWHWSYQAVSDIIWKAQVRNFKNAKKYRFKGSHALQSVNLFEYVFFTNSCN